MIQPERIQLLNDKPVRKGRYVLYWMQASQRADYNHALEFAAREANDANLPLVAVFGLTEKYPEANARHYAFMLEGLRETRDTLRKRGVQLVVLKKSPEKAAAHLAKEASMVVADAGYLEVQRSWRLDAARKVPCRMVQVESDVVVPVQAASGKEEFGARTIRPKILRLLEEYMVPLRKVSLKRDSLGIRFEGIDLDDVDALLRRMKIDRSVGPSNHYRGGASHAERLLEGFIKRKLADYESKRNDPSLDRTSHMSPYLHFGQISPLRIAMLVDRAPLKHAASKAAYLEELIVRRELSVNFVYFNENYATYGALPEWARRTLGDHASDPRDYVYSPEEWEQAETHDPYWNAAQNEMRITGKMHNYMRMYWGKKILEWSESPEEAFRIALYLNNKYELDGRNPNSFAGVAWCFGKHDRPWGERPVYGKVRSMVASGLRRKFDIESYVQQVEKMKRSTRKEG